MLESGEFNSDSLGLQPFDARPDEKPSRQVPREHDHVRISTVLPG